MDGGDDLGAGEKVDSLLAQLMEGHSTHTYQAGFAFCAKPARLVLAGNSKCLTLFIAHSSQLLQVSVKLCVGPASNCGAVCSLNGHRRSVHLVCLQRVLSLQPYHQAFQEEEVLHPHWLDKFVCLHMSLCW